MGMILWKLFQVCALSTTTLYIINYLGTPPPAATTRRKRRRDSPPAQRSTRARVEGNAPHPPLKMSTRVKAGPSVLPSVPAPPQRSTRARGSRPGPSTQPASAELDLVARFIIIGVEGPRKIPVSDAVSRDHPVPQVIKNGGSVLMKMYIDDRIKNIEEHNQRVMETLRMETENLRETSRGNGVVQCPDCEVEVPWGSALYHKTRVCP